MELRELNELATACRNLISDKVTERKKHATQLRQLLKKKSVIKYLDSNSGNFVWTDVLKDVVRHVNVETHALQKSKASQTGQAIANKKREVASLFKFVVEIADKRGPQLKSTFVVKHIINVLEDNFMFECYGQVYSSILLKHVLSVRKYLTEIPAVQWLQLLKIYCHTFQSNETDCDHLLHARLIYALIQTVSLHTDLPTEDLLKFYTDFFQSSRIRKEKLTVVEYILRSVNLFVKLVGAESRQQMCKLGEVSILQLLYVWNHKNSFLQTQIIEFLHFQMKIHHPGGAKTEEFGAFAVEWDLWRSHLKVLCEKIYNDLQEMASRHTFSSSPRENVTILDSQYAEFAADVYHQVLSDRVIEVTQQNFEEASSSCNKKRRLESGWLTLREEISSIGINTKVIPWLQLVKYLLHKYPTDLSSEDDFLPMLQTLAQFLADSKRTHVTVHLLNCLQVLAPLFKSEEASGIWAKVWATCLRIGNLHLCKDSSYHLMSIMLHYSLVQPQKEMWNLFVPLRTSPTEDSVRYLATYCSYYDLPEQYQPVLLDKSSVIHPMGSTSITNSTEDFYPLRKMLIEWLLPSWEDEGESDMTVSKHSELHLIDCDLLASMLVSLCLSWPVIKADCCHPKISKMELSSLESTYLEMAFKMKPNGQSKPCHVSSTSTIPTCFFDSVMSIFLDRLKKLVSHVLKLEEVPETLQKLAYMSCLLSKCLAHLLDRNVIDQSSRVFDQLHTLLKNTMIKISQLQAKLGNSCVHLALPFLIQMFSPCGNQQELHFQYFKILRSLTSYKVFVDIVSNQIQQCKSGTLTTQHTQSAAGRITQNYAALDDDFDVGFGNTASEQLDDESDEEVVGTDTDKSQLHTIDLFSQKLNAEEQLSCQSLHFLCLWCSYDHFGLLNSDPVCLSVRDHIESNLPAESFDVIKPFHLQMLKIIISTLCCSGQHLPSYSISYFLQTLMNILKQHYRDQDIAQTCIELVTMIIPHLSCGSQEMASIEMTKNRDSILQLFLGIWKLQNSGKYHSRVRLALAKCLLTFIQNDPEGEWTVNNFDDSENIPMWRQFPNYLSDTSLEVRLYCARNISSLFCTRDNDGKIHPLSRHQQEEIFQKVYECTEDCLNMQLSEFSADRQKDERCGRIASLLHALSCVAISSRLCERNAIFACCSHIQLNSDITVASVQKVLSLAAQQLRYSSLKDLIISHLPFLINKWLTNHLGMAKFPYQLLDCSSEMDFYMKYPKVCLPFLMLTKHEIGIEANLIRQMGDQWLSAELKQCVLKLMVHILPYFAVSHYQVHDEKMQKKVEISSEHYKLLLKHISKEDIEQNIQKRLSEQVVEILLCLEQKRNRPNVSDPSPNPPFYSYNVIMATLNFLTVSFTDGSSSSSGEKPLVYVLSKAPENFQKILQSLAVHLGGCTLLSEQYRAICRYELFVKLLLQEFNTSLGGCRDYIMREVIYRLLHTIKNLALQITNGVECSHDLGYLEDTIVRGLCLVETISKHAITNCPQEFCKYLPQVIHALLPYSTDFTFSEDVLRLLKLVVIDNSHVLKSGILLLDPFPDTEVLRLFCEKHNSIKYEHGEFTLAQEMESFLKNGHQTVMCGDIRSEEGLKFLHSQLSTRTNELKILLDQGKAEHRGNIVCELVQELARLVQNQSGAVAEAAATCLGDIGPIDLTSWTSSSQHNRGLNHDGYQLEQSRIYQSHPSQQKYFWIFYWLNQYLIDSCLNTVQAASQVLSSILSTKTGKDFTKNCLSQIDFLYNYLHPFVKKRSSDSLRPVVNNINIDDPNLWNPPHDDHGKWIKNLICSLICSGCVKDEILQVLEPICNVKAEFCELVLPYLVHDILVSGKGAYNQILTHHINNFFAERCTTTYNRQNSLLVSVNTVKICMNKQSVQKMLDVVQYLRHQPRVTSTKSRHSAASLTPWENNFWLDFNYSHIANAANFCSAHFSAILYTEIWWYAKLTSEEQNSPHINQDTGGRCFLDSITLTSDPEINVQEILLKAYREIGDPDGPYGCGAGILSDTTSRIQTYEHENQWGRAAVSYDIALSQPTPTLQHGILHALHKYGLSHVLETYLRSMENADSLLMPSKLQELRYEAAWQAGQWNLNVPSRVNGDCKYNQSLYVAMANLSRNQIHMSTEAAHAAKLSVMQSLRVNSLESCSPLYQALSQLTSLSQLSHILHLDRGDMKGILEKWNLQLQLWNADFEYVEPIHKLQCLLLTEHLKGLDEKHNSIELLGLCTQFKQLIKAARKARKYEVAERSLHLLKSLKDGHKMDESISLQIDVEESMLLWERGEHTIAKHLMKTVIKHLERKHSIGEGDQITELYSMALNAYGNWLAETRTENPRIIIESYLEKAVSLLQASTSQNSSVPLDAFISLACYSHTQYINTTKYMESTTFEAKKELLLKAQHEVQELKSLNKKDSCVRLMRTLERQSAIDEAEVLATQEDCNQFLKRAVVNFIKCLRYGDSHDLHIFTLISLWFENAHSDELIHLLQKKGLNRVKTSKFLPLMYQLAARMGCEETPFYITLNKIIEQVTQDHPHHSLHIVMALANANKDDDYLQTSGRHEKKENANENITNSQDRAKAAKKIIQTLCTTKIAQNVRGMEMLCEAYIELANFDVDKYKRETKPIQLPSSLRLTKLKNLRHVAVATSNIPIDPSGVYADIPYVTGFEPNFKLAGGINLPKIILCNGSNGLKYRQLVKGRDDLRQDAIMQQVFGLVNKLLDNDADAHKRQLNICTYKVIPLSQRSGLLEWCEGTQPLGEYLVGKDKGAHQRYYPQDWSAMECRRKLLESPAKRKEKIYEEICQNFHPVLRHFFFEKFFDPVKWYECRTAYVKSVATNSIVGYILGLGDRHVQNILINCETAQLVHIDLGVAFEQGRILPTPETVPFRLTRDIVDGMGVSGVEGIFRRCCEKTMLVMHNNQQSLLTILQVLLYDPLYNWTLSPGKAHQLQQKQQQRDTSKKNNNNNSSSSPYSGESDADVPLNSDKSTNVNKVAERVLMRLQQKLQGIEDGVQLSLVGQINHLIQEAQDPKNLCKLFPGWQPYI